VKTGVLFNSRSLTVWTASEGLFAAIAGRQDANRKAAGRMCPSTGRIHHASIPASGQEHPALLGSPLTQFVGHLAIFGGCSLTRTNDGNHAFHGIWSFDCFPCNAAKRSLRERFAANLILAPIFLKRWQRQRFRKIGAI
jgi:hypothetical protein